MKRSYTYLKGLLTLALAALTGWMWAAEWTTPQCTSYDIVSGTSANIVSPVLMPEITTETFSFTVTIRYSGGNEKTEISKVELFDPETNKVIATDSHYGASGSAHNGNVYTLSNIAKSYSEKTLVVVSHLYAARSGNNRSKGTISFSDGVVATSYNEGKVYSKNLGINFANDKNDIGSATVGNLGINGGLPPAEWVKVNDGTGTSEFTVENGKTIPIRWTSSGTWSNGSRTSLIGKLTTGYLDNNSGQQNEVVISSLPACYDVAIILSGDNDVFSPLNINGTDYTYVDGALTQGSSKWGTRLGSDTLTIGTNVMFLQNLDWNAS